MRTVPARRLASTALCATLLVAITGPAAVAADSAHERTHVTSQAPVPGADALLAQVKSLGNLGTVLKPVTDLLNTVLAADNGQLTPEQATQLGDAVKAAIAQVTAAAPAAQTKGHAAKDVTSDALTALQTAVDALLKAATSGDVSKVLPAATAVVTGLVNLLAAILLGSGLPAPNLPGLPALPSLPGSTPLPLPVG